MICSKCGIESKDDFCPRCGEQLRAGAVKMTAAELTPPPASEAPVSKKRRKPPLRMKMVIWPAIALFLPLAYLFFDFLVLLSEGLFAAMPTGGTYLSELMRCLSDVSFATNSLGELTEATFGETVALLTHVSPVSILPAIAAGNKDLLPLLLPVALTALLALGCAACGVLLILTGGRILRLRLYRDLTLFVGGAATFAPLLGNLLLRVIYCMGKGTEAADAAMLRVLPSLESLCIMGILACALLPALGALRGLGAYSDRAQVHVGFPFRVIARSSYRFKKVLILLFSMLFLVLIGAILCLPVTHLGGVGRMGDVKAAVVTAWDGVIVALARMSMGGGVEFDTFARDLLSLSVFIGLGLMLFGVLNVLLALLRVMLTGRDRLAAKKGPKRALRELSDQIRAAVFSLFGCVVVLQLVQIAVWLFVTPAAAHVDFSNASETVSLLYLAMGQARLLGGTTTVYAFAATVGVAIWYAVTQCAFALLNHACGAIEK